jgi:hypothetical protein
VSTSGSAATNDIVIGPWIEALVRQYRAEPEVAVGRKRLGLVLTALVAAGAALAPMLLRLDHDAHPSDPEELQALEACGRADPTFVRYFASDRAACYKRFPRLMERAAAIDPN